MVHDVVIINIIDSMLNKNLDRINCSNFERYNERTKYLTVAFKKKNYQRNKLILTSAVEFVRSVNKRKKVNHGWLRLAFKQISDINEHASKYCT